MSVCLSRRRKRSVKPSELFSGDSLRFARTQVHFHLLCVEFSHAGLCRDV